MLVLSTRQPWAWAMIYGGKDIENRTWPTDVRGRVAIQATLAMTRNYYRQAVESYPEVEWPDPDSLAFGGIIGTVDILDCVRSSLSKWFNGPYGFVLARPKPVDFRPCKGVRGRFFEVPW